MESKIDIPPTILPKQPDNDKPIVMPPAFITSYYGPWRQNRIKKLTSILGGREWFKNKTVLELGCGVCHVGMEMWSMGSKVTCTTGHVRDYNYNKKTFSDKLECLYMDQDKEWGLGRVFDLVIHWGVLYHLDNWKADLKTALNHGHYVCLETEVADSPDPNFEIKYPEGWYDGAVNGVGTRMTPAGIEQLITECGRTFTRYDDDDIGFDYHTYSWKEGSIPNTWKSGYRRFWFIKEK